MSKFKFVLPIIVTVLMVVIFHGVLGYSESPHATVKLTTDPPASQILPFQAESVNPQSPVKLTLQAIDESGKQLQNTKIHFQLLTPSKNPWFSTDFPIVEGTKLLDIEAIAPEGKLQVEQILPLRGTYQLLVNVTSTVNNAFNPIQQTLTLSVSEHWVKYRNFLILIIVLFVLGLVGGWVIGGKQSIRAGEIAPLKVRLLLSVITIMAIAALLVVNISAEFAESHNHNHDTEDHHQSKHDQSVVLPSPALDIKWLGDESATVGKLAQMAVQVKDTKTGNPVKNVNVQIKATQIEHNQTVFVYENIADADGKVSWKQQFFDGSTHKLAVEVSPQPKANFQFEPFQTSKEIEVEPIAPPLSVRLISLAYFIAVLILGLVIGIKLQNQWIMDNG